MTHISGPKRASHNCALSWVLGHFHLGSGDVCLGKLSGTRHLYIFGLGLQTALPPRAGARGVERWPSAGTRRGQDAGLALLRNEAVHTVLPGPRAVSCLVFCSHKARDG